MTSSLVNGRAVGKVGQTLANADSRTALIHGATRWGETRSGLADLDQVFSSTVTLPFHPNGLTVTATRDGGVTITEMSFFGGGFVVQEGEMADNPTRAITPTRARFGET